MWLIVDNAIIFLKSSSHNALAPLYIIVSIDKIVSIIITLFLVHIYKIFIMIKSPAVTRVLEWTSDEIGVGAAIALNNQDENMNRALLVTNPITNIKTTIWRVILENDNNDTQGSSITSITIKIISPRRLLSIVVIADWWLFLFE